MEGHRTIGVQLHDSVVRATATTVSKPASPSWYPTRPAWWWDMATPIPFLNRPEFPPATGFRLSHSMTFFPSSRTSTEAYESYVSVSFWLSGIGVTVTPPWA